MSECSKAYKLFDPLTKRIVTNQDVVFDEENTWDWNRQQPIQTIFDIDSKRKPTPVAIMHNNSSEAHTTTNEILPATRCNSSISSSYLRKVCFDGRL